MGLLIGTWAIPLAIYHWCHLQRAQWRIRNVPHRYCLSARWVFATIFNQLVQQITNTRQNCTYFRRPQGRLNSGGSASVFMHLSFTACEHCHTAYKPSTDARVRSILAYRHSKARGHVGQFASFNLPLFQSANQRRFRMIPNQKSGSDAKHSCRRQNQIPPR